jgi:hypothetical protein
MNSSTISNLNNSSKYKKWKQIWTLGDKHLVIIDESIIQKLQIRNNLAFVEQEITADGDAILMRIRRFE